LRFVLEEIAAGLTVEEVLSLIRMTVHVADEVGVTQENWSGRQRCTTLFFIGGYHPRARQAASPRHLR
jgi:hypothetical protein